MRTLAIVAVALVTGLAAACGGANHAGKRATSCRSDVDRGVLPPWARTGFSDPRPRIAHVMGHEGRIAAILFAHPLRSPPPRDAANKILWVPRTTPQGPVRFVIRASQGDRTVTRVLATGPGPSYVDLPAPGCWRLQLRWGKRTDTLDLDYADNRR